MPTDSTPRAQHQAIASFLADLRRKLGARELAAPLPFALEERVRQVPANPAELPARFTTAARAGGIQVVETTSAELPTALLALVRGSSAKTVFVEPAAPHYNLVCATLRTAGVIVFCEPDDETLFSADAGVTGVTAAIAETGSLVCESGTLAPRGASLIPPMHIAIVNESQIFADLVDFFAALADRPALAANVNLISGPSKTADIEGVLVTGVHGPGRVVALLVRE